MNIHFHEYIIDCNLVMTRSVLFKLHNNTLLGNIQTNNYQRTVPVQNMFLIIINNIIRLSCYIYIYIYEAWNSTHLCKSTLPGKSAGFHWARVITAKHRLFEHLVYYFLSHLDSMHWTANTFIRYRRSCSSLCIYQRLIKSMGNSETAHRLKRGGEKSSSCTVSQTHNTRC